MEKQPKPKDIQEREKLESMIDRNIAWLYGSHTRSRSVEALIWSAVVLTITVALYLITKK